MRRAGTVFWSVVYPFDTAKTMMQTDDLNAPKYRGFIDACRKVTGQTLVCQFSLLSFYIVRTPFTPVPTYAR